MTRGSRDFDRRLGAAEEWLGRLERRVGLIERATGTRPRPTAEDWHARPGRERLYRMRLRTARSRMSAIAVLLVLAWAITALPAALATDTSGAAPDPSATVTASASPTPTADPVAPADPATTADPGMTTDAPPSPTDTSTPAPTDTGTPTATDTNTPTPTDTQPPSQTSSPPVPGTTKGGGPTLVLPPPGGGDIGHSHARHERHHRSDRQRWQHWRPSTNGTWSTRKLDRAAARARRRGWSTARIAHDIYAPFPVMGPANWSDSWGAPRYVGGYHPHAGQDVLCRWGAPVLAVEDATVTYGYNTLGGKVAYLSREDGSFWYYAHLSRTADRLEGTAVAQGDIIGRCGATGDATVPHVHFGFEDANGTMLDPLHALRIMLRLAEAGLYHVPNREPLPVPTPDPSGTLPPLPWPRHPLPEHTPSANALGVTDQQVTIATSVIVAIGVLGPLAFLYRRTRRTLPPPSTPRKHA
jgi:murein DD-endopeptidase MepM/ murein hydrolase activator NlpD